MNYNARFSWQREIEFDWKFWFEVFKRSIIFLNNCLFFNVFQYAEVNESFNQLTFWVSQSRHLNRESFLLNQKVFHGMQWKLRLHILENIQMCYFYHHHSQREYSAFWFHCSWHSKFESILLQPSQNLFRCCDSLWLVGPELSCWCYQHQLYKIASPLEEESSATANKESLTFCD